MMTDFYTRLARYYDKIYEHIDYKTQAIKIHELIQKYKKSPGKDWLDVACGTGTHIMHLKDKYHAMGIDLNESMLEVAREKCPEIEFIQSNMTNFNLEKKFDVITCLFGSIGYLTKETDLIGTIQSFSKHTKKGGVILIEPIFTKETVREGSIGINCVDLPDIKIARVGCTTVKDNTAYLNFNFLLSTSKGGVEYFEDPSPIGIFQRDLYLSLMEKNSFIAEFVEEGFTKEGLFIGVKV